MKELISFQANYKINPAIYTYADEDKYNSTKHG